MSQNTTFSNVSETLKTRLTLFGKSSVEIGKNLSEKAMTGVGKMKDYFQAPTPADRLVEETTGETLVGPDWGKVLLLCDHVNTDRITTVDVARAIKKRLLIKNPHVQMLALTLLEAMVKNCEKMFSEVASEKVLDEMVRIADDRQAPTELREKSLRMIESWGESTEQLRFLPVYEETYKSLKSRGVKFPGRDNESLAPIFTPPQTHPVAAPAAAAAQGQGFEDVHPPAALSPEESKEQLQTARNLVELLSTVLTSAPPQEALQDDLTSSLVAQCRQAQAQVQRVIEGAQDDNENLMFEALAVHDELEKVLARHATMLKEAGLANPAGAAAGVPAPAQGVPSGGSGAAATDGLANLRVVDEDDSGAVARAEETLKRNRPARAAGAGPGEEAAMADLDKMIFGSKGEGGVATEAAAAKSSKDDKDDMIVF
eukprot:jgi/Mesen1/4261/ME000022S03549